MSDYRLGFSMEEEPFAAIKVVGVGGGGCNAVDRMIDGAFRNRFYFNNTIRRWLAPGTGGSKSAKVLAALVAGRSLSERKRESRMNRPSNPGTDMLSLRRYGRRYGTGAAQSSSDCP